jgi:dTDP-4-dehydrorhamnose reductase
MAQRPTPTPRAPRTRILLFGSDGMLGRYVRAVLQDAAAAVAAVAQGTIDLVCLARPAFDAADPAHLARLDALLVPPPAPSQDQNQNQNQNPERVVAINCIGLIPHALVAPAAADAADAADAYYAVNAVFPIVLAGRCAALRAATGLDVHLVHVSTDCVFSGKRGAYTEADAPDAPAATYPYGHSKAEGDRIAQLYPDGDVVTVLRTSIVGEEDPARLAARPHQRSLLEWVRQQPRGARVAGYVDHLWNGVTCLQLARMLVGVALGGDCRNRSGSGSGSSLHHVFSPDPPKSKYELVRMIAAVYDRADDLTVQPVAAPAGPCDRTLGSVRAPAAMLPVLHAPPPLLEQLREQRAFGSRLARAGAGASSSSA